MKIETIEQAVSITTPYGTFDEFYHHIYPHEYKPFTIATEHHPLNTAYAFKKFIELNNSSYTLIQYVDETLDMYKRYDTADYPNLYPPFDQKIELWILDFFKGGPTSVILNFLDTPMKYGEFMKTSY